MSQHTPNISVTLIVSNLVDSLLHKCVHYRKNIFLFFIETNGILLLIVIFSKELALMGYKNCSSFINSHV